MSDVIKNAREIIQSYDGPKLRIMEVCGTHTHEIFKMGIRNLLPENIDLISGPGCPVCVTPVGFIDEAIYLALEKGCVITTFGDLIKQEVKAQMCVLYIHQMTRWNLLRRILICRLCSLLLVLRQQHLQHALQLRRHSVSDLVTFRY